jgi:hypothetical protein
MIISLEHDPQLKTGYRIHFVACSAVCLTHTCHESIVSYSQMNVSRPSQNDVLNAKCVSTTQSSLPSIQPAIALMAYNIHTTQLTAHMRVRLSAGYNAVLFLAHIGRLLTNCVILRPRALIQPYGHNHKVCVSA